MKALAVLLLFLAATAVVVGVPGDLYNRTPTGGCPLCHAEGIPVPERDQIADCQCEKWWRGQAPARLVFADCSHKSCAESGADDYTARVFVDIQLYRCPHDGLLFTDPE